MDQVKFFKDCLTWSILEYFVQFKIKILEKLFLKTPVFLDYAFEDFCRNNTFCRSNFLQVFLRMATLKNFTIFPGQHPVLIQLY